MRSEVPACWLRWATYLQISLAHNFTGTRAKLSRASVLRPLGPAGPDGRGALLTRPVCGSGVAYRSDAARGVRTGGAASGDAQAWVRRPSHSSPPETGPGCLGDCEGCLEGDSDGWLAGGRRRARPSTGETEAVRPTASSPLRQPACGPATLPACGPATLPATQAAAACRSHPSLRSANHARPAPRCALSERPPALPRGPPRRHRQSEAGRLSAMTR